jgi:NAD(P) transhydrogenase subunit beta
VEVEKARQVIVLKRSMAPGFAGVENPLFFSPKTSLLFGDARATLTAIVQELKHPA